MTAIAVVVGLQLLPCEATALPPVRRLALELHWQGRAFAVEEAVRIFVPGAMIGMLLGRATWR